MGLDGLNATEQRYLRLDLSPPSLLLINFTLVALQQWKPISPPHRTQSKYDYRDSSHQTLTIASIAGTLSYYRALVIECTITRAPFTFSLRVCCYINELVLRDLSNLIDSRYQREREAVSPDLHYTHAFLILFSQ